MNFQELFKVTMARDIPEILPFKEDGVILNVGCGEKTMENAINLDYPEYDADTMDLPFKDNTLDGIHAYHFLEHVKEPVKVLQDFQRVLAPGGIVNIVVPYYNSQMYAHDLDHKHPFCEETWKNLFRTDYYDKNKVEWKFRIGFNVICGIVERNMCLLTQLIKE